MSVPLRFEAFPKTWDASAGGSDGAVSIRIGARRLMLADIQSVAEERVAMRDDMGLQVAGALFLLVAIVLIHGVFVLGWLPRYLAGAVLLAVLGAGSVVEAFRCNLQRYTRVRILTAGGEILYATARPDDARTLVAALAAR